jgi:hypothetical protein
MDIDDATDLPINLCVDCKKEVLGYVDDPEIDFRCEKCTEVYDDEE